MAGYTIPNEPAAAFAPQARLFQTDLEILALAHGASGVISGCAVAAQGSPDMTVAVAAGVVQSLGTRLTFAGGNATFTAADGTNPRLDVVVVTSGNALAVRAGTAAANPLLPTLTAGDIALARVYVPANDTTIGSTQIIDARVLLADYVLPTSALVGSFLQGTASGLVGWTREPILENSVGAIRAKDTVGTAIHLLYLGDDNIVYLGTDPTPATNGDLAFMVNGTEAGRFNTSRVLNIGSGDSLTGPEPLRLSAYAGTSGTPITTVGANVKITRQETISAITQPNPADNFQNAALSVLSVGTITSTPQVTAVLAQAQGGGTTGGADICGLNARAYLTNNTATGYAIGVYSEGRRDFNTGKAHGAEITANNNTATAGVHTTAGASDTVGIWLPSRSSAGTDNAVGIQLGALTGSQWLNGLAFNVGSVLTNSIRDDSDAATSIRIDGAHATAAIGIDSGAGFVGIGTLSPAAALHVLQPVTDPAVAAIVLAPPLTIGTGKAIISVQGSITPTAALGAVYGLVFIPIISGTEGVTTPTITSVEGIYARIDTAAAYDADIFAVRAFSANGVSHAGGGTITHQYGYYCNVNTGTARVTNSWQFYAAGTSPSWFGGDVWIADGKNIHSNATTGTKIGTATTQKLGFFNATPVVQPTSTTDLRTALINLGLYASGGASPLDLNGGALTTTGNSALGQITIADAKDVILNTTTGTKIGTAVTQKLGFFNATPVVQPAAAAQAAAPAGGTGTAAGGWDTAVNRDAAIATINAIRTALVNLGIMKGAA